MISQIVHRLPSFFIADRLNNFAAGCAITFLFSEYAGHVLPSCASKKLTSGQKQFKVGVMWQSKILQIISAAALLKYPTQQTGRILIPAIGSLLCWYSHAFHRKPDNRIYHLIASGASEAFNFAAKVANIAAVGLVLSRYSKEGAGLAVGLLSFLAICNMRCNHLSKLRGDIK